MINSRATANHTKSQKPDDKNVTISSLFEKPSLNNSLPEFNTLFKIKSGLGDDESHIYPFDKIVKHEVSKMTSPENDQKE